MIKVAICDDDYLIAHKIENIIWSTCNREKIKVDTEVYYNGITLAQEVCTGQKFDLIYLDIEMENGDGISAAKSIRRKDENAIIIFVSSYDKYMMELFRLDVFSFIKKPIDNDTFSKTFLEANQKSVVRISFLRLNIETRNIKFYVMKSCILKVKEDRSVLMKKVEKYAYLTGNCPM